MQRFHFPTAILFGNGALAAALAEMRNRGLSRPLLVTDPGLLATDLVGRVETAATEAGLKVTLFSEVHPNPLEEDVEKGVAAYKASQCDCLLALGGGSALDAAKVIKLMVAHAGPLARYDDAQRGYGLIVNPMPPLAAIPTTAGTGSEVGRSGVIVLRATQTKTIFFHPRLIPDWAVLEPVLTAKLPPALTAATGIDALTHCLEAYFTPSYHPMADGIALEGIRLILRNLPVAYKNGGDLEARGHMQMAAAMGATAFQKGLGMVHSLAHPLSARYNTHHGLANALLLPASMAFLERMDLPETAQFKIDKVMLLFMEAGLDRELLSQTLTGFFTSLGIRFGLRNHGVPEGDLEDLSHAAFADTCHTGNAVPVTREYLLSVYRAAF